MKIGKYNFELRGFKHIESLSEETDCFSAILYINRVAFATCRNSGQGGQTDIHTHPEQRHLEDEIREFLKTQPKYKWGEHEFDLDLELVIDIMVEKLIQAKFERDLTRKCKKALLFELPDGTTFMVKWKMADIATLRSSRNGIESMVEVIEREVAKGAKLLNKNVSLEMLKSLLK